MPIPIPTSESADWVVCTDQPPTLIPSRHLEICWQSAVIMVDAQTTSDRIVAHSYTARSGVRKIVAD